MLMKRIIADHKRCTSIVPLDQRRKYRRKVTEVLVLRNAIALFMQISPFLQPRLPEVCMTMTTTLATTDKHDSELLDIIAQKPMVFSCSQLASLRTIMKSVVTEHHDMMVHKVQSAASEVLDAKMRWLEQAVRHDYEILQQVQGACSAVAIFERVRRAQWDNDHDERAADALASHMDHHLRISPMNKIADYALQPVHDYITILAHIKLHLCQCQLRIPFVLCDPFV